MSALWTLLLILIWAVGILAVLVLLILAFPFDGRAVLHIDDEEIDAWVAVRWGWGLLSIKITSNRWIWLYLLGVRVWRGPLDEGGAEDRKKAEAIEKNKKGEKKKAVEKKETEGVPTTIALRWLKEHRRWLLHTGRQLIEGFHLRFRLQGVLGLDDPADTFLLFELLAQLERLPGVDIDLERDYLGDTIDLDTTISARVWLLEICVAVLIILWRRETRRALFALPWLRRQTWRRSRTYL